MIRRHLSALMVKEILSVQPMSLDPPVCNACMLLCREDKTNKGHPWRCIKCGDFDTNFSLSKYNKDVQKIINSRTIIYDSVKSSNKNMKVNAIIRRYFMYIGDTRDPNDRYRPWLEENVGKQGIEWNWDLAKDDYRILEIVFSSKEHAVLFTLTFE